VVWSVESVCHAPDKRLFFREARRLLRDGGRLGMAEYIRCRRPDRPAREALLRSWLSGWAIPDIATGDELRTWAQQAGFGEINLSDVTPNVEPSLRRLFRLATAAWPAAILLRAIGLRSHAQQGNVRGARNQYRALKSSLWFYGLFTATTHGPGTPGLGSRTRLDQNTATPGLSLHADQPLDRLGRWERSMKTA